MKPTRKSSNRMVENYVNLLGIYLRWFLSLLEGMVNSGNTYTKHMCFCLSKEDKRREKGREST